MRLPGGIIFINNDLNETLKNKIIKQLFINEVIDGYEFDDRVIADPNYPTILALQGIRLLVIRSFFEETNRELADVVIFVKAGLASVLKNGWGPPGKTYTVENFYIYQLLRAADKIT